MYVINATTKGFIFMMVLLEKYSVFFILPALTLLLSLVFTRMLIPVLYKFNVVAPCGERHIHKKAVPTMGGIAIVGAFSIVMFLSYFSPWKSYFGTELLEVKFLKLFIPLIILIPCCIIDDKFGIRVRYKLLLQILTAILSWYCGARINNILGYNIPEYISLVLTILWTVSFINAFNLIDGLDGLAAGISVVSAICLSMVFFLNGIFLYPLVLLCLAASCLGFLRYNFYPAKIFMGDTGSMFLGYMFATVALLSSSKSASFSAIAIPVLACGIPLIDTFLAVWRRITFKLLEKGNKKRGITIPDKEHLHHRFLAQNKSQRKTAILFYRMALAMGSVCVIIAVLKNSIPGITLILLLLTFSVIIQKFAVIEIWNSTRLIFGGFSKPSKSVLLNMLHPLWDLCVVSFAVVIAACVLDAKIVLSGDIILLHIVIIMSFLFLSKNYKVFWFRAGIVDYMCLGKTISLGSFIAFVLNYIYIKHCYDKNVELMTILNHCFITYIFICAGILGERFWLRWLQAALIKYFYESRLNENSIPVLIFGGGLNACILMRSQNSYIREDSFKVEGIIDDNPALKGLYVYGYKVLGSVHYLDDIYKQKPFKKVIITTVDIKKESRKILVDFCKSHDIEILYFSVRVSSSDNSIS